MENAKCKIIYEDNNLLVINKPARMIVFSENFVQEKSLINYLLEKFSYLKNVGQPFRYGIVHRLDKDTSGILLVAKNNKTLKSLQEQFQKRRVVKKYLALVMGKFKESEGKIETLIGRSLENRKKQKVYLALTPDSKGKREAKTSYKVLKRFKDYTLLEVEPKTGRKHQIRCHLNWVHHPIAGDKVYGFKNQPCPKGLKRQFLHASYLKIKLPDGKTKEFRSELPEELEQVIINLKSI